MASRLILPLLSILVLYTIFYHSEINGTNNLLFQCVASKTLPGPSAPLRTVYTGFDPLDQYLSLLTVFFWPATNIDVDSLPALMHLLWLGGTFGSAWVLVILEAWRKGNSHSILSFPFVFGLLAQALTFAFAAPLYFVLQLLYSVTARRPSPQNICVPPTVLSAIPIAFIVGFIIPSALFLLPTSEWITTDLKQIFISLWQPWPAYVSILITIAYRYAPLSSHDDDTMVSGPLQLRRLRYVYAFAFAYTAITHIAVWAVPIAALIIPQIFQERALSLLHPLAVFSIRDSGVLSGEPVETLMTGVHAFLLWDYIIGSASVLIWALCLYQDAHRLVHGKAGYLGVLTRVLILSALVGPAGAAVELVWERDEMVFATAKGHSGDMDQAIIEGKA